MQWHFGLMFYLLFKLLFVDFEESGREKKPKNTNLLLISRYHASRLKFLLVWTATWRKPPSAALQRPFIPSPHRPFTLRYTKVLFSSALMRGLWGVVSVVGQFSDVSEVNTLCVTQICKCFRYNTGFFLDTYRASLLPESRRQPLIVRHSRLAPNPGGDNMKAVHAGGWICILWVSEQWPKQQRHVIQTPLPSRPPLSSYFLWYQQTTACGGDLTRISALRRPSEGPPGPLLGRDVFTPLFVCTVVPIV